MFSDTLAQHLLTAGMAVALGFAMAVLLQAHNRAAHRWLALFLLCMGLVALAESLAIGARTDPELLRWQGFIAWSVLALAPALFMYIRHLLSATPASGWLRALHFAPALVLGLPLALFAWQHADAEWWRAQTQLAAQAGRGTPGVFSALLALQWAGYGVWSWLLLQTYRQRLLAQYSNIDQRRMGWLGGLIACLPVLLFLWLLARVGGGSVAAVINTLYVPVGVLVLALLALRQPTVLLEQLPSQPPQIGAPPPVWLRPAEPADDAVRALPAWQAPDQAPELAFEKVHEQVLEQALEQVLEQVPEPAPAHEATGPVVATPDEVHWSALQARLTELLHTERPYLDADLSLRALAQQLHTSTHHLSHILNQRLGQSFYELINQLRVREVQRCLRDPAYAAQSILDIALDSGFSSKATFNAAFRRYAGTTPSEYRHAPTNASQA
jgi:AraC-like DNA-binding protein